MAGKGVKGFRKADRSNILFEKGKRGKVKDDHRDLTFTITAPPYGLNYLIFFDLFGIPEEEMKILIDKGNL